MRRFVPRLRRQSDLLGRTTEPHVPRTTHHSSSPHLYNNFDLHLDQRSRSGNIYDHNHSLCQRANDDKAQAVLRAVQRGRKRLPPRHLLPALQKIAQPRPLCRRDLLSERLQHSRRDMLPTGLCHRLGRRVRRRNATASDDDSAIYSVVHALPKPSDKSPPHRVLHETLPQAANCPRLRRRATDCARACRLRRAEAVQQGQDNVPTIVVRRGAVLELEPR